MAEETAYAASRSSDYRALQKPIEELEYSDEEKNKHKDYYESRKPRKGWKSFFQREQNVPALNCAEVSRQQMHV